MSEDRQKAIDLLTEMFGLLPMAFIQPEEFGVVVDALICKDGPLVYRSELQQANAEIARLRSLTRAMMNDPATFDRENDYGFVMACNEWDRRAEETT